MTALHTFEAYEMRCNTKKPKLNAAGARVHDDTQSIETDVPA